MSKGLTEGEIYLRGNSNGKSSDTPPLVITSHRRKYNGPFAQLNLMYNFPRRHLTFAGTFRCKKEVYVRCDMRIKKEIL